MNRIMYPYELVANQLLIARTINGLSQRQLSALSGVPQPTICRYESGVNKRIDAQSVQAIAEVLNIKLLF